MALRIQKLFSQRIAACWLLLLLCLAGVQAAGQELVPLEVGQHKAVHLIFEEKIRYCATGSQEVSYTVTGNIVKLQATKAAFPETNLTIITEDDRLYSFLLLYSKNPRRLNLQPEPASAKQLKVNATAVLAPAAPLTASLNPGAAKGAPVGTANAAQDGNIAAAPGGGVATTPGVQPVAGSGPAVKAPQQPGSAAETQYLQNSARVIGNWQFNRFSKKGQQAGLELRSIYQDDKYLYFTLHAFNASPENILIDFVNFQQGDRKGVLRRMYREALKKPIFVYKKQEKLTPKGQFHVVYVFEKFTIDPGKKLLIELGEKDGKRFYSLSIPAKFINKADELTAATN